jgi:hypothetical protein
VDLQLLFRVLWRFKVIFVVGLMLATALAFLSYVRVDLNGTQRFSYREPEQWESLSTLFVTTQGFPWGAVSPRAETEASASEDEAPEGVDPARLSNLAALYMELATSDDVLRTMLEEGPINGFLQAYPVRAGNDPRGDLLPLITLSASSDNPRAARALAGRHVNAFSRFLKQRQRATGIFPQDRVVVEVLRQPQQAQLVVPRKKTRPIVLFLTVMIAISALAFVLENMRPRVRPVAAAAVSNERRSA